MDRVIVSIQCEAEAGRGEQTVVFPQMDVDLEVIPIDTSGSFHENIHFPFDILLPFS
jgi:hypothetical protein